MTDNEPPGGARIPQLCQQCTARHKGICGALTGAELARMNKISDQRKFPANTTLYGDSQDVPYFANVLEGVIKLSKYLSDGRQQIVALQFAPDFMGRPFSSSSELSVETASDVTLCTIPRRGFETFLADSPGLQERLLRQTLIELDETREWMVTLGRKTAREKVASFLVRIAAHIQVPDSDDDSRYQLVFDLPLTRTDMADFLGLTVETVSRQLSKLRKSGILEITHNRHVEIIDLDALLGACEETAAA